VQPEDHGQSFALRRDAWQRIRPEGGVERLHLSDSGWDAGTAAVDRAIDAGAGVLLLIDEDAPGVHARAIAALYSNGDATSVISGTTDDLDWMRTCSSVRDAMVVLRPLVAEPQALLAHDPRLACMVSALLQAAARRTPVVFTGPTVQIAAVAAQRIASQSTAWMFLALDDEDAAAVAARRRTGLTPWASLCWQPRDETAEALVRALVADLDD
jgi:nicotinate-nucleotide--dimethylbenzimidazole phosphoribosyltransferase